MYRKLIPLPVVLCAAVAVLVAYRLHVPPAWAEMAAASPLGWLMDDGTAPRWGAAGIFLRSELLPFALSVVLAWAAAFHPVRRPAPPLAGVRWVALILGVALAGLIPYLLGVAAGTGARILAAQTDLTPTMLLAVSQAPHQLLKAVAFALILTASLYALVRGGQVRSLPRSTFEAWAEARRLVLPGVLLLVGAALVEAFITPMVTAAALL